MQISFVEIVKIKKSKGIKDKRKKGTYYILSYVGDDGYEYRKSLVLKNETKFNPILKGDNKEISSIYNEMTL